MTDNLKILQKAELFKSLSRPLQEKIANNSYIESYERGNIVFFEGQKVDGIYILDQGKAKGYQNAADGRQHTIRIIEPGDIIAEAALFEEKNYPVSLEILEKARLLYIPADKFIALLKTEPDAALELIAVLSKRLRFLVRTVHELSLKEVPSRLARYLLELADKQQNSPGQKSVTLPVAKSELACNLGTIPETLSRTLKKLEKLTIIRNEGNKIIILNPVHLQEIADGKKI